MSIHCDESLLLLLYVVLGLHLIQLLKSMFLS